MDAGRGLNKVNNVKLEVERNGNGCDRLSELPDALLIKILCGMPIFQAILTSELSKRWKSLWMYLPNLDFGFDNSDQFIEGVLTQNKGGTIEGFSIYKAYTKEEDIKIGSLISFTIARRVKKLKLYLSHDDRADVGSQVFYKLPERLFLCESVVELDVWSCNFSPPSVIRMSCLKSCSLFRTEMSEGTILHFTSSCPVIEKLKLRDCNSFSGLNIVLRNPSLLKLEVYDGLARDTKIMIDAPCVTSLVITSKNKERNRYLLKNLSSLIEATLNFEGDLCCGGYDHITVGKIINSFGHAKHLHLNNDCVKVLTMFEITHRKGLSIKSPRLEINTELEVNDIPGLSFVFRKCPLVENLKITLATEALPYINLAKWLKTGMPLEQKCIFGSDLEIEDMPKSLSNLQEQQSWIALKGSCSTIPQGLKNVEICGFYNVSFLARKVFEDKEAKERILEFVWREIKLVESLLEGLANLDRLIIRMSDRRSIEADTPMGRKLLSLPRASQKLVFA